MAKKEFTVSREKGILFGICAGCLLLAVGLCFWRGYEADKRKVVNHSTYFTLPADVSTEDPLLYLGEDFEVLDGFHSNLPIVILSLDEELKDYKEFTQGSELVTNPEEAYVGGRIRILESGKFDNRISDAPVMESALRIKKRGHTSYDFDKKQFLLKLVNADGTDNDANVLGMGEQHTWILNGSMADKSMIRNYLAYRIAAEIDSTTPDAQFCEVIFEKNGKLIYQGVYLMMESIARDVNRIPIENYNPKNKYTSYIIRRDRFTNFDPMLDTYGRLSGLSEEWIGVKYPSVEKLDARAKKFIEDDFAKIEKALYSESEKVLKTYDMLIDIDSFADYFLINEFFGNYDAGMHSTYMYKNAGEKLKIGPVWDFDQAMNNYFADEMETETLAFQERPFYSTLTKDIRFLKLLEARYAKLRTGPLNEDHINAVIDEAVAYLTSARAREWYRWAADYLDGSGTNWHNYYLADYEDGDMIISRFNDNYDQEIYNIKVYLHKHGKNIALRLVEFEKSAIYDTSVGNRREFFLMIIMVLFFAPAITLVRRDG